VLPAAPPPPPSSGVPLSCQHTPTPVAELQSFSTTTIAINAIDDSNNDEHHPKQQLFLHERTFLSSSSGQVFRERERFDVPVKREEEAKIQQSRSPISNSVKVHH
jgi:hypothetical protein